MSRLIHVCLMGIALAAAGCGAQTPEIGPAQDTKQADPDQMKKVREESMKRNANSSAAQQRGADPNAAPSGQQQ